MMRESQQEKRAFSLIELLVVIGIIGLLASVGLPALRGLTGSTDINSATRQLLDDLGYARLQAISRRTTVYMVFVSPKILTDPTVLNGMSKEEQHEVRKLIPGQYTTYALYAPRSLGDQPGNPTPKYLTEWKSLPAGVLIDTNKFDPSFEGRLNDWRNLASTNRPMLHAEFPFPLAKPSSAAKKKIRLPCVAFNYQGQLLYPGDEYLRLVRGTVIPPRNDDEGKTYKIAAPEVLETPRGNSTNNPVVRVDWLTGRARTEFVKS
jgi:prepilin-type N-terminal cleavage/methylation domain-containing protein